MRERERGREREKSTGDRMSREVLDATLCCIDANLYPSGAGRWPGFSLCLTVFFPLSFSSAILSHRVQRRRRRGGEKRLAWPLSLTLLASPSPLSVFCLFLLSPIWVSFSPLSTDTLCVPSLFPPSCPLPKVFLAFTSPPSTPYFIIASLDLFPIFTLYLAVVFFCSARCLFLALFVYRIGRCTHGAVYQKQVLISDKYLLRNFFEFSANQIYLLSDY